MNAGGVDGVALIESLRAGRLSCEEVAGELVAAVGEDELRAWAWLDPEQLLARAGELDRLGAPERDALALFGMPVGIKDCFDTAGFPTTYGSPIYDGHRPSRDARAVALLREAGAILAGMTKCAEFAWMHPPDTVNPLDRERTPGGSSSGSAAAVAAGWVPVATGTQTAGSINRPASYCGVLGYKPTFGSFPREGVKPLSATLDTVGIFARSVRDLRLASGVLSGVLPDEPSTRRAQPLYPGHPAPESWRPRIGFARTPHWDSIEADARDALEQLAERAGSAGAEISELELPASYDTVAAAQRTIQWVESAAALALELTEAPSKLSDELRTALEEGASIPLERYLDAKRDGAEQGARLCAGLSEFDAVLTPSAPGVPPLGLEFTGDPLFSRAWTLIGAPCVSVPRAWTAGGLPAGAQLVGPPFRDDRVLSVAEWLMERV